MTPEEIRNLPPPRVDNEMFNNGWEQACSCIASRLEAEAASGQEAVASLRTELEETRRKLAAAERERNNFKQAFDVAIISVDRVFQIDSTQPPPLLPVFLSLGESKFEGVIKLAKAYITAESRLTAIAERVETYLGDQGSFQEGVKYCCTYNWHGVKDEKGAGYKLGPLGQALLDIAKLARGTE